MAQFEAIRNCTVERELQVRIDRYLVEEYEELRPFVIEKGCRWTGTATELLEIAYSIYDTRLMLDDDGEPRTFMSVATEVFSSLSRQVPNNAFTYVYQAFRRKGVRRKPFTTRYRHRLLIMKNINPLWQILSVNMTQPMS